MPEIKEMLTELSERMGVRSPSLYITELSLPGSFIIGENPRKTSLVFPRRLLGFMTIDQIEAMLAYNLVQIDGRILSRTFAALLSYILTMPSSFIRWISVFLGFGDYYDTAPKLIGLLTMGFVAPPAASIIQSVAKRDYDGEAVHLCGKPRALISAIEQLETNNVTNYHSLGFLCLIDPQDENFFEYLYHTHLPKEIRIKNIVEQR